MDNAGINPSRVLQYSIDARLEPQSPPFDCGHNFRIGAAEKGMEDSIIKTRGDGTVLPWTMPALTPHGCHSAVLMQPLQPVYKTRASIIRHLLTEIFILDEAIKHKKL